MSDYQAGPVTLLDVATEAGVSMATASRAFNGSTRKVHEDLRLRVLAAAAKLDYTANTQAQAMARGRTNVVGLVVHDIADPFFSVVVRGLQDAAVAEGLGVLVGNDDRELAPHAFGLGAIAAHGDLLLLAAVAYDRDERHA